MKYDNPQARLVQEITRHVDLYFTKVTGWVIMRNGLPFRIPGCNRRGVWKAEKSAYAALLRWVEKAIDYVPEYVAHMDIPYRHDMTHAEKEVLWQERLHTTELLRTSYDAVGIVNQLLKDKILEIRYVEDLPTRIYQ